VPSFEEFFSVEALEAHYGAFLQSHLDVIRNVHRVARGSDRVELAIFRRDLAKHLRAASRKVLQGRYTFAALLEREIPKDAGETRTISISTIRDAIVQRALYGYLYEFVEAQLEDCVFGYRRGRNAHGAVALIQQHFEGGRLAVFDADISQFFDSVNHQTLIDKVSSLGTDDRARNLVTRFLKTSRVTATAAQKVNVAGGKQRKYPRSRRNCGVPQGGVLSGLLSNLYLAEFDRRIQREFDGLVRYADDFVICVSDEEKCHQLRAVVESELKKLGLKLHLMKTVDHCPAAAGIDFLGFRISPIAVRIRHKNILRFKERINGVLSTQKVRRNSDLTLASLCNRLSFKIQGPGPKIMEKLIEHELADHPFRRSWIGFFRIVTDDNQVRQLDRWIASQISSFIWRSHRVKVTRTDMRSAGLPTLYATMWKARRPPRPFTDERVEGGIL